MPGIYYLKGFTSTVQMYPSNTKLEGVPKVQSGQTIKVELDAENHQVVFYRDGTKLGIEKIAPGDHGKPMAPFVSVYHSDTRIHLVDAGVDYSTCCGRQAQVQFVEKRPQGWVVTAAVAGLPKSIQLPDSNLTLLTQHTAPLLYIACSSRSGEALGQLLAEHPDVKIDVTEEQGGQLLELAYDNQLMGVIPPILESNAGSVSKSKHVRFMFSSACKRGDKTTVQLLINSNADVNGIDSSGEPVLSAAVSSGSVAVVQSLLDHGAAVKYSHACGLAPGDWVTVKDISKRFNKSFVDVLGEYSDADGERCGSTGQVQSIAKQTAGWKIAVMFEDASQPLYFPSATLTRQRAHPAPLLYFACQQKNDLMAHLLFERCATLNATKKDGARLLWLACVHRLPAVIKDLLTANADSNAKFDDQQSLLSMACERGYVDVASLLLRHNAAPTTTDVHGETPLVIACKQNQAGIARCLLDNGATLEYSHASNIHPGDYVKIRDVDGATWGFNKMVSCSRRNGELSASGKVVKGRGDWYWVTGPEIPDEMVTTVYYDVRIDSVSSTSDLYVGFGKGGLVNIGDDSSVPGISCFKSYTDPPKLYPSDQKVNKDHKTRDSDVIRVEYDTVDKIITFRLKRGQASEFILVGTEPIKGPDANGPIAPYLTVYHSSTQVTLLGSGTIQDQYAGQEGQVEGVQENASNTSWRAAVTLSSSKKMVQLSHVALEVADKHPSPLLYTASIAGNDVVAAMVADSTKALDPTNRFGVQLFDLAADKGLPRLMLALFKHCKDKSAAKQIASAQLITACAHGNSQLVKSLVEVGADINVTDKNGNSACAVAYQGGHTDAAKWLVENGAPMAIKHESGYNQGDLVKINESSQEYQQAFEQVFGRYTALDAGACGKEGVVQAVVRKQGGWVADIFMKDGSSRSQQEIRSKTSVEQAEASYYGLFWDVKATSSFPVHVTGIIAGA